MTIAVASHAQQYRSEVKELDTPPPAAQPQDAEKLLQATTDPYARALLLRELAAQAAGNEDYAAAARYLEQAIDEKSLSGAALQEMRKSLTDLYVASGRHDEVIKALEGRVKNNPDAPPEQQAALAAAYIEFKRFKEAVPLLERAVSKAARPDESWLQALYAALQGAGRQKDSMAVLERLLRLNPARREYWLQLAGLQLDAGQTAQALALMELATRQGHIESGQERLQIVSMTAKSGAPFEAGSLLQSWMESGQLPKNAQNYELLAGLWLEARESQLAIFALTEAIAQAPKADLYLQLGQLHMDREEYPAAATALNQGLQQGSRSGPVLLALGTAWFHSGNVEAAQRVFEQARSFPQHQADADQWLEYLASDAARRHSLQVAQRTLRAAEREVALSNRLLGRTVRLQPALPMDSAATPDMRTLGGRLTPIGAERDGSIDGVIPPWDGGITAERWPEGFRKGQRIVDPYPDDKPLFVITQENAAQYADKLTSSHRMLLSQHPTYRMPVYPTRRSVAYPQAIYDATQANIGKAKLTGSDALEGARLGFPFPLPQNGVEVMWNHRVRYRGNSVQAQTSQAVVTPSGITARLKQTERVFYRYANVADPVDISRENILLYYLTWFTRTGSRGVDFLALAHETANSIKDARAIWVMPPNMRRMFRIPPVGYDQPFPGSEAIQFIDMIDMYNGAFDRYVWKLVGKRELYIPYNSYRLNDGRYRYDQFLTPNHFNPEGTRYELHRVWVIEATERGGTSHSFGKRIFYVDEDSWNVVLVENYDRQGRPWRFQEGHLLPLYDSQSSNCLPVITYDLKDGRYFVNRLSNEDPPPQYDIQGIAKSEYMPANVRNRYAR
jgi:lipopolysaccharide biosynthesis regulator YciM